MSIGILGGTFNPIHIGHTLPAQSVATSLALDKVVLLPANIPPHKEMPTISAQHRANMVKLACKDSAIFDCDTRELNRDGHSYTVDTLKELNAVYPKQTLYFIMGMDSLLTFTTWHNYQEILTFCHIVVTTRPGHPFDDTFNHSFDDTLKKSSKVSLETAALLSQHRVKTIQACKDKKSGCIIFSQDLNGEDSPLLDISSTEIRSLLKKDPTSLECSRFMHKNVLAYIQKNQLYL
ncbi:MAG: nicotinate-nucleotide adenylyltransferase [Colwellia sp.]